MKLARELARFGVRDLFFCRAGKCGV